MRDPRKISSYEIVIGTVLATCGTAAVFWPGFLSVDSLVQLESARTGHFANGHPPQMSLLWRPLDHFFGPSSLMVLHSILFWSGLLHLYQHRFAGRRKFALSALVVGCFPPIILWLGTIWKDVSMIAALTLAFSLIHSLSRPAKNRYALSAQCVLIVLLLGYAEGVRFNAPPAVLPLCFYFASKLWSVSAAQSSRARVCALGLSVWILLAGAASWMESRAHEGEERCYYRGFMVHDLAAITLASGVNFIPDFLRINPPHPTQEELQEGFVSYWVNPLVHRPALLHFCISDPTTLFELWRDAIAQYPLIYLEHRARFSAYLFDIWDEPNNESYHWGVRRNNLGVSYQETKLQAFLHEFVYRPLQYTLVYRGIAYVVLAIAILILAIRRNDRDITYLMISGICSVVPLLVVGPAHDFRYLAWLVVAVVMSVPLTLFGKRSGVAKERLI